jgi:dihydropteroate synthase
MADKVVQIPMPGFKLDFSRRSAVMAILNVTDDSFSDGGLYYDTDKALAAGLQMAQLGADIIDIGPESSRPGSGRISPSVAIRRSRPVIERLRDKLEIPMSIDTYDASVAEAAIKAGASMINDISAGADPGMFELAAKMNTPIVLMHMKGTPENMQKSPVYENVVDEVLEFLLERADRAIKAGVDRKLIIIDPGIGFGKTLEHNLLLLRNLDRFVGAGFAVLVGASRKGFIGELTGRRIAAQRAAGTIATSIAAQNAGVGIVRVHDVADNLDALKVAAMIQAGK